MSTDALKQDDQFLKHVGVSFVLHISVVLIFTVKVFLFPGDISVEEPALRVDLVALPDKLPSQPAASSRAEPVPPKKAARAEPAEKTVILNPKADNKKKQKDALNKLKQMSALENLEKEMKQAKAQPQTFKGNQLSAGSSPRGLERIQHDSYVADITNRIRAHWAIPQWLANRKLRARIRVRVDDKGNIVGKEVVQSSGDASFDEAALSTLEKASPMPKPPEKIQRFLAFQGFVVGFPE